MILCTGAMAMLSGLTLAVSVLLRHPGNMAQARRRAITGSFGIRRWVEVIGRSGVCRKAKLAFLSLSDNISAFRTIALEGKMINFAIIKQ